MPINLSLDRLRWSKSRIANYSEGPDISLRSHKAYVLICRFAANSKKNSFLQTIVSCPKISQSNQFFVPVAILHIGEGGDNIWSVVKVVLWSRGGGHLTKPGWSKPHTHSNPTNLTLFRHKITLYRFNQGAHTIAGGLKWKQGGWAPRSPSL